MFRVSTLPTASSLDRVRARVHPGARIHDPHLAENLWLTFEALRLAGDIDDARYPHVLQCAGHLGPFLETVRDAPEDLVRVIRDTYPAEVTAEVFRRAQADFVDGVGLRKQAALFVVRSACVKTHYRVDAEIDDLDFDTPVTLGDFTDVFRASAALAKASFDYLPPDRMDQYVVVTG